MVKIPAAALSALIALASCSSAPNRSISSAGHSSPFQRSYTEGELLNYRIQMTHYYDGLISSTYDARAAGIVKHDSDGFFEEFEWVSVADDGKSVPLNPLVKQFRQILSLAPPFRLSIPSQLTSLGRFLIGPITDLLTFYVDESLVIRQASLRNPGDHVYLKIAAASSWGSGQDCIDFEVTLLSLDRAKQVGEIKVSHLPPEKMCIKPPAQWMENQVTDTPNNWFDVHHSKGKWVASVGKETFEVIQRVDLKTGKILSATMDNPVVFQSRECLDEKLLSCSGSTEHKIVRRLTFGQE